VLRVKRFEIAGNSGQFARRTLASPRVTREVRAANDRVSDSVSERYFVTFGRLSTQMLPSEGRRPPVADRWLL